MSRDKLIKARVYQEYEPKKKKFKLGLPLNFYLSDISAVMEAEVDTDCVINLSGHLFIIEHPYEKLLRDWNNLKTA